MTHSLLLFGFIFISFCMFFICLFVYLHSEEGEIMYLEPHHCTLQQKKGTHPLSKFFLNMVFFCFISSLFLLILIFFFFFFFFFFQTQTQISQTKMGELPYELLQPLDTKKLSLSFLSMVLILKNNIILVFISPILSSAPHPLFAFFLISFIIYLFE